MRRVPFLHKRRVFARDIAEPSALLHATVRNRRVPQAHVVQSESTTHINLLACPDEEPTKPLKDVIIQLQA